jgi:signal transduction histidine kinase/CheY-like chemotaxis protein
VFHAFVRRSNIGIKRDNNIMIISECTIVNSENYYITLSSDGNGNISAPKIKHSGVVLALNAEVAVARDAKIDELWDSFLNHQQKSNNGLRVKKVYSAQVCIHDGRHTVVIGPYGIKGGGWNLFAGCCGKKKSSRVEPLSLGGEARHIEGPRQAFRIPNHRENESYKSDSDDSDDSIYSRVDSTGSLGAGDFKGGIILPRSSMGDTQELPRSTIKEAKERSASSTFKLAMGEGGRGKFPFLKETQSAVVLEGLGAGLYDDGGRNTRIEVLIVSSNMSEIEKIYNSLPAPTYKVKYIDSYRIGVELVKCDRASIVLLDESCAPDMRDVERISDYCRNIVHLCGDDDACGVLKGPGDMITWEKCLGYETKTFTSILKMLYKKSQRQRRIEQTMHFMPSLTLNVDRHGKIVFVNEGSGKMLLQGIGARKSIYKLFPRNVSIRLKEEIHCVFIDMKGRQVTKPLVMDGGATKWITFYMEPVLTPSGVVENVLVNCVDVTEQKVAALRLEELKARAERMAVEKERMSHFVSHEGRNALAGMKGNIERLKDSGVERLECLDGAVNWLEAVFSGALEYSKARSGKVKCEEIPFEISEIFKRLKDTASIKENVALKLMNNKPLSSMHLLGDPNKVYHILSNLCGNAIKFTREGSVAVRIALKDDCEESVRLRFEVEDTGIGMTEEERGNIFQAYSQANASIARTHGGTGLGLSIAKEFVVALGGDICVESKKGVGSLFSFELDIRKYVEEDDSTAFKDRVASAKAVVATAEEKKAFRVLLVEDGASNRDLMLGVLKKSGYESVEWTDRAEESVKKYNREEVFDLILMDQNTKGKMQGTEATKALRSAGYTGAIYGLSGDDGEEYKSAALSAGQEAYLTKPVDNRLILRLMDGLIVEKRETVS